MPFKADEKFIEEFNYWVKQIDAYINMPEFYNVLKTLDDDTRHNIIKSILNAMMAMGWEYKEIKL